MTDVIEFWVFEEPIPKPRPRAALLGGHVRVFTPRSSERAEDQIAEVARGVRGDADQLLGAVAVTATAYLRRPISAPKRVLFPIKKPDLDNLIKTLLDGLNRSGIWRDDSQVVHLDVTKEFTTEPRWHIRIEPIDKLPQTT